ncbi:MAG TPA: HD domain-containing phosphohydrolase [Bdellovibrionota bacterium]|jgi:hypothetical protein
MKVLLIDDDGPSMQSHIDLLSSKQIKSVAPIRSIQEGIETIEAQADTVSLAICNYRGGSTALMKLFLQLGTAVPSVVFADEKVKMDQLSLIQREAKLEILERGKPSDFLRIVDLMQEEGVLESRLAPDADFIKIRTAGLNFKQLPPADIYIRLATNRYCRRFKQEDGFEPSDLEAYCGKPGSEFVYIRRDTVDGWMANQHKELDSLLGDGHVSNDQSRKVTEDNLEIVHNVVSQLGFTPKVEELAKKTVALTLKALGSSPQLSDILRKMQMQDGKYISSHSLMLAEITCAIAHRMSWSSAPTFLKLTVASFLHDLNLPTNRLAKMKRLEDITEANGFSITDFQTFKAHPIAAAEYARQMRQLPADVDTIVLQHHEQPDGSGFPRGLYHHQISPLACVFIVAQDLLDFFLANSALKEGGTGGLLATFLSDREATYSAGTFKKIIDSMRGGGDMGL